MLNLAIFFAQGSRQECDVRDFPGCQGSDLVIQPQNPGRGAGEGFEQLLGREVEFQGLFDLLHKFIR